ncbi:leucine-rich repeat protein [Pseudobutyrivibrio sp.]|uniref:leucine-rich repeat protein n=1 Tax=Pseudobutyrivibrio sp. TaxID=2014367 RepID=UPI001DC3F131|nr:leucine-rich repeat protein [Pseudobutyrivibrio sp.]MBE5910373.1 hypothetical protein [Pseudobutyrivibrio sp.]
MRKNILIGICVVLVAGFVAVGLIAYKAVNGGIWIGDYKCMFVPSEKKVHLREYRGNSQEITIPTEILGFRVKAVSDIYDTATIEKIIIPKEIEYIDITGNENLKEVVFEEGTTKVNGFITECENISNITFPDSLENMSCAFFGAKALEDVTIPQGVTYITFNAFPDTAFEKNHSSDQYYVVGDGVLLFYNGQPDEIVIPEGVKQFTWSIYPGVSADVKRIYISDTVECADLVIRKDTEVLFGTNEVDGLDPEYIEGTLVAPEGSYIEQFCKENGVDFRVMTEDEEADLQQKTESADGIVYQE